MVPGIAEGKPAKTATRLITNCNPCGIYRKVGELVKFLLIEVFIRSHGWHLHDILYHMLLCFHSWERSKKERPILAVRD